MWFNEWLEVRKAINDSGRPTLEACFSFRNGSSILGPISTPYPVEVARECFDPRLDRWPPYPPSRTRSSLHVTWPLSMVYHVYPTRRLERETAMEIESKVKKEFSGHRVRRLEKPFHVVQVAGVCHERFMCLDQAIRARFILGHYSDQLRVQLGYPFRKVCLDSTLEELVPALEELQGSYEMLYSIPRGYRQESREWKMAEATRECITKKLSSLDPRNAIFFNAKTRELNLRFGSLNGITFQTQQLSVDEFLDLTWVYLDSEKKNFAYPHGKNCHVALLYVKSPELSNGRTDGEMESQIEGEIHTTEHAGVSRLDVSINGSHAQFKMVYYKDDISMVDGAKKSVRANRPSVLRGHYLPHDMQELRKVKEKQAVKAFGVGIEQSDPRIAAARAFMARLDLRGMVIIDSVGTSRILDPQLPSHDLETVAGIKKSLTYQTFDRYANSKDPERARELAWYVGGDVLSLLHHDRRGAWKNRWRSILQAAYVCNASVAESSHSPAVMKRMLERECFEKTGTYRSGLERQDTRMKLEKRCKDAWPGVVNRMLRALGKSMPPGRYESCCRVYLPIELAMFKAVRSNFPFVNPMLDGFENRTPQDRIAICQYLKVLVGDVWISWFEKDELKSKAEGMLSGCGLSKNSPISLPKSFWNQYKINMAGNPSANLDLISSIVGSEVGLQDARRGFDLWQKASQSSVRFFAKHGIPVEEWERKAASFGKSEGDVLASLASSQAFIGRAGQWIYIEDPCGIVEEKGLGKKSQGIFLDKVTLLKLRYRGVQKIVFCERGQYHGIELNQKKPSDKTLFESKIMARMIDAALDGKGYDAYEMYAEGLKRLEHKTVSLDEFLVSVPKKQLQYKGFDRLRGEVEFSYEDRDMGLKGFDPHVTVYINRFRDLVGSLSRSISEIVESSRQGRLMF